MTLEVTDDDPRWQNEQWRFYSDANKLSFRRVGSACTLGKRLSLRKRPDTKMKIAGWLLIVLGFCAPFVTMELVDADRGSAAYTAGSALPISIITIVITFVLSRSMEREIAAGRAWLVGGAIALAAGLWSSFSINRGAIVHREYTASQPDSERINKAAAAEGALLNSGRLDPNQVLSRMAVICRRDGMRLSDAEIPLRARFVEFTRRSRGRELAFVRGQQEAIRASGIRTVLAADHLIDAQARIDARGRIARYRSFLDSYDRKIQELQEKSEADMQLRCNFLEPKSKR